MTIMTIEAAALPHAAAPPGAATAAAAAVPASGPPGPGAWIAAVLVALAAAVLPAWGCRCSALSAGRATDRCS